MVYLKGRLDPRRSGNHPLSARLWARRRAVLRALSGGAGRAPGAAAGVDPKPRCLTRSPRSRAAIEPEVFDGEYDDVAASDADPRRRRAGWPWRCRFRPWRRRKWDRPRRSSRWLTTNGTMRRLADLRGKVMVLEWTNADCPFTIKHYTSANMQNLQKQAAAEGVVWLSVISSAPGEQGYVTPAEGQPPHRQPRRRADRRVARSRRKARAALRRGDHAPTCT